MNKKHQKTEYGKRVDIDEFLYKKQFQRRINPLYIPLTKEGFFLCVLAYLVFIEMSGGLFFVLMFALAIAYIYKNRFSYKYTEFEQL
ncbi:MAG TPA: hypothetical protein ENN12_03185, partial [Epsilonproteobacteria bacterium]|nr:hypothetical protein [Campylobacterota bacterium]